jgi:predicted nucleotide-binding protein (sugar kinase/HSP70/actin superfamily)
MMEREESIVRLFRFGTLMRKEFRKIPIKRNLKPLRVIISGEIHVLLEQYVNFDIMKKMGELGMEVYPTFGVFDWLLHKMHINLRRRKLEEIARPFIPLDIGGEAQWDIGAYIEGQKNGFDGMVIVYPFTCMPETTLRGIIEGNNPDPFYMPALYFSFDESSAFEGMRTRLEAFVDMMNVNRANNPKFKDRYEEPKILSEIYDKKLKSVSFRNILQKIAQPVLHRIYIDRYREIPKDKLYAYYLGHSKPQFLKKSTEEHTQPSKLETVIGQS